MLINKKERKSFSSEQKARVALDAVRGTKGSKTIEEIALEYGIHQAQVSQWKRELLENAASLFDSKRGPKPTDAKYQSKLINARIENINMELEKLKKLSE
jgi:transposase